MSMSCIPLSLNSPSECALLAFDFSAFGAILHAGEEKSWSEAGNIDHCEY